MLDTHTSGARQGVKWVLIRPLHGPWFILTKKDWEGISRAQTFWDEVLAESDDKTELERFRDLTKEGA
jgi:hypothetical protein